MVQKSISQTGVHLQVDGTNHQTTKPMLSQIVLINISEHNKGCQRAMQRRSRGVVFHLENYLICRIHHHIAKTVTRLCQSANQGKWIRSQRSKELLSKLLSKLFCSPFGKRVNSKRSRLFTEETLCAGKEDTKVVGLIKWRKIKYVYPRPIRFAFVPKVLLLHVVAQLKQYRDQTWFYMH